MATRKRTKKKSLTPEQQRNADIFRLRGFYSNAKTLPFTTVGLTKILWAVDTALEQLGATTQTEYMRQKAARTTK